MDLTIVYYTSNSLREPLFTNVQQQLVKASGNIVIISVSQKPMNWGQNICVGDIGRSHLNIYRQMLVGAKAANTKYIAFAEDDTLYSKEHFTDYRPKDDEFAYDMSRWSFYTWTKPPIYSIKDRRSNSALIAPRDLFIEAIEERFAKYPKDSETPIEYWGEPGRYEGKLGVTKRKTVQFYSKVPCITFSHPDAVGFGVQGTRKALGELRAYDIPYWGKAENMLELWGEHA